MKTLIQQLQDGEIAVKNDGSLEELKRVLKVAFPEDTFMNPSGKYYYSASKQHKGCWRSDNNSLLPTVKTAAFIKELDNRTTMKTRKLTRANFKKIHDIACGEWRQKLLDMYAADLALNPNVNVSEDDYQKMRKACTPEQNALFDKIFGKDEPEFKAGDWVFIGKESNSWNSVVQLTKMVNGNPYALKKSGEESSFHADYLIRKATSEEIKKAQYYPDGTPCLVKNGRCQGWQLRYANGNGSFYLDGKKRGSTTSWNHHMKLDRNNLPVND